MTTRTVCITGAGSGLGKDMALLFADKGYRIVLVGRNEQKLKDVKELIEKKGGQAFHYSFDIRSERDVQTNVKKILETTNVQILVNNAGIGHFGTILELTSEQINEMMDTNVYGTINMTRAFLPHLLEQPNSSIINIISTAGLRGKVKETAYCASKFAVRGFTEALQKELDGKVNVVAAYMGGMNTPFWDNSEFVKDPSILPNSYGVAKDIVDRFEKEQEIIIET